MGPVSLHREEIGAQTHTEEGPSEDAGRDSLMQAKERGLGRNQPGPDLDLQPPAPEP